MALVTGETKEAFDRAEMAKKGIKGPISEDQAYKLWKQYKTSNPDYLAHAKYMGMDEGNLNAKFASRSDKERTAKGKKEREISPLSK